MSNSESTTRRSPIVCRQMRIWAAHLQDIQSRADNGEEGARSKRALFNLCYIGMVMVGGCLIGWFIASVLIWIV